VCPKLCLLSNHRYHWMTVEQAFLPNAESVSGRHPSTPIDTGDSLDATTHMQEVPGSSPGASTNDSFFVATRRGLNSR
jgi:hypothetical protein